ncbi:MAG TPA: Rrf2 family transcriptional regulator [Longimicrobium sp.]
MTMSSRFAVAVHILTLIENGGGEPVTSEYIAGSVNTNPAVVRRLLQMLTRAGLTRAQLGTGGGALLARPASEITLLDVYRAVDEGELFALHREDPNPACPVGRNIQASLRGTMDAATRALEAELARRTVADMLADVRQRDRRPAGSPSSA